MTVFRAAAVQMDSGSNRGQNLIKIKEMVSQAGNMGAKLVILPETSDYIGDDFVGNAWDIQNAMHFFSGLARENGVYLHCGSITEQTEGRPRNTTLFFAPDGTCICRYSKLHMFDVQIEQGTVCRESDEIRPGNEISVAKTQLGTFGFAICYDIRFGEMFRLMAQKDARVFCVCANFTMGTGRDHWETLLRARAIENACYVIAANQIGSKPKFQAYGNSMIIDPWGRVVAQCDNQEAVVIADIDMDYVNQVREKIPSLSNRRNDIYQLRGEVGVWQDELLFMKGLSH